MFLTQAPIFRNFRFSDTWTGIQYSRQHSLYFWEIQSGSDVYQSNGISLFFRRQHHGQTPPFQLGELFDAAKLFQVRFYALQKLHAQILMRHLSPPKPEGYLRLVSLFQESSQVTQLGLIITFICAGPKFYLL